MILIAFRTTIALLAPILLSSSASGRPAGRPKDDTIPEGTTTTFNGQAFVNKGLVGFGSVPPSTLDSTGLTLGGLGSAAQFVPGSWKRNGKSNLYTGKLIAQPDRGHNTETTVDYQARQQIFDIQFTPYYSAASQTHDQATKSSLRLSYDRTLLYSDADGVPTTGLNPLAVRPASGSMPPLPIASATYDRLSVDPEGLVVNADGSFWVSDEYGPYVYRFSAEGKLLSTITQPYAALPYIDGALNFTSETQPTTGRSGNQGFEGLTASADGRMLWALLQSATVQDGGRDDKGSYTRLFGWDVSQATPVLTESFVLQLPVTNGKGKALAASDIRWLNTGPGANEHTFVVLSRDGKGNGDTDPEAKHKDLVLATTKGATNLVDTEYTITGKAVAPKSKLASGITAIQTVEWIDMLDDAELARFGLQNGGAFDETLISAKWEAVAIVPALDDTNPHDYFVFVVADNDFITQDGIDPLGAYADVSGLTVPNQILVYRVSLPSAPGMA